MMTSARSIVAWQPVLTDHQAFTFRELARVSGSTIVAYVLRYESAARQKQGWGDMRASGVDRRLTPASGTLAYCIRRLAAHRNDVHLFCSPFEHPILMLTLLLAILRGCTVYLISEPYSTSAEGYLDDGNRTIQLLKSRLRPIVYGIYGLVIAKRIEGVFAISSLAVRQFRAMGVPDRKVFPFGYFIPRAESSRTDEDGRTGPGTALRLIYVGSLIRRKGVDILIAAVRKVLLDGVPITLDVYGPGDASALDFDSEAVRYCGVIGFGDAQKVIAGYQVLVVPSRFDGWGVAANEALCSFVPIVCSDNVGSRTLIEKFKVGAIFRSEDVGALTNVLRRLAVNPQMLAEMKSAVSSAAAAIQPCVAAKYMAEILAASGARGVPSPWYQGEGVPGV